MAYRNPQSLEESSMAHTNHQWPRGILNGLEESSMAYRNPQWPTIIVNGAWESLLAYVLHIFRTTPIRMRSLSHQTQKYDFIYKSVFAKFF